MSEFFKFPASVAFNNCFAGWGRIEPRSRSDSLVGIEASIADPLWMMCMQRSVLEYRGEDAGSPVDISVGYSTQKLERIDGFCGRSFNIEENSPPVEAMVEGERSEINWKQRIQFGQFFERIVRESELSKDTKSRIRIAYDEYLIRSIPDGVDENSKDLIRFALDRALDGGEILTALKNKSAPIISGLDADEEDILTHIQQQLISKCNEMCFLLDSNVPSLMESWRSETLDYKFALAGKSKQNLIADDYRNGELDWYTFKARGELSTGWSNTKCISGIEPNRLRIGGPSLRWWEFENAALDFGAISVDKVDLAKLSFMEFIFLYGDDWFTFPLTVELNNLVQIQEIEVRDVFNQTFKAEPARVITKENPRETWDLYSLSKIGCPNETQSNPILFIPHIARFGKESKPLEEVQFSHDPGNYFWAIENKALNAFGDSQDGFDIQLDRLNRIYRQAAEEKQRELDELNAMLEDDSIEEGMKKELREKHQKVLIELHRYEQGPYGKPEYRNGVLPTYRLMSSIPHNWFPLIPTDCRKSHEEYSICRRPVYKLRKGYLLQLEHQPLNLDYKHCTAILSNEAIPLEWVNESSIGREGLRVQLTKQRIRWGTGKTFVWMGRKILTGSGEVSSGLKFDSEVPKGVEV